MALIIGDQFSYQGQKPLDARLKKDTLADLLSTPDTTVYDGILAYVAADKKYYTFDSNNMVDATLGKWREFKVDSSLSSTLSYSKSFTVDVNNDEDIAVTDINVTAISDIKIGQYINDKSGIFAQVISIDTTNQEVKIRVLTKDTIIKNEIVEYTGTLDPEINKVQTVDYNDVNVGTTPIADFDLNHLLYDQDGTLAKVVSKDETNGTLTVIPVTVDVALNSNAIYLYERTKLLEKEVNKQYVIPFADIPTCPLITDLDKDQMIYDIDGTLAKIDSVDVDNSNVTITIINLSPNSSLMNSYEYIGAIKLNKLANAATTVVYTDLNTTVAMKDIKLNQLVYDEDGTIAKITYIDIPNNELLVKTMSTAGMPFAPDLKELVVKTPGTGYTVGDIVESSTTGVFGEVTEVGPNGELYQVVISTQTSVSTTGSNAVVDYDTVIYGAFGKSWAPLSNTSVQVAQIVSKTFNYDSGYEYEIISGGSGYQVGDIIKIGTNPSYVMEVVSVNGTAIEKVKYSRETMSSTAGSGANITLTANPDVFIIPNSIWKDSQQNSFELTNDLGASVEFNRLDGVTSRCAAGEGSIYKFEFDSVNGVIYQEKTEIAQDNSGIGRFVPLKNYKVDDVVIEDNLIYICNREHTAKASFGEDIVDWTLMTKLHSSGMRKVIAKFNDGQTIGTSWTDLKFTYVDGDKSMIGTDEFIIPQDGLYAINIPTVYISSNSESKFMRVVVNNSGSAMVSEISFNNAIFPSTSGILTLKKDDKIVIRAFEKTARTINGSDSNIELILLTDDQSDNLIAEADVNMTLPTGTSSYKVTYSNSTSPSIINNNGDITLPEDGSYLIDMDALITSGPLTLADRYTYIRNASDIVMSSNFIDNTGSLLTPSVIKVVTGIKGDKFHITQGSSKANTTSGITKTSNSKVRLFKIKSTNVTLSSKDLYADYLEDHKNDVNILSYEDWVAKKYNEGNLTVTAPLTVGQDINDTVSVLTFAVSDATGEIDMIKDDNKIVAPVSGLYSININELVVNNTFEWARQILSKNSANTGWEGSIDFSSGENINVCPGLTKQVWLNKGDYISVKAAVNTNMVVRATTTSPEANRIIVTLLHTGAPDANINYPNTWKKNQEVYLGNNLWGYRATGTITASANESRTINIKTGIEALFSSGGQWQSGSYQIPSISSSTSSSADIGETVFYISNITTGQLTIYSCSNRVRTNATYDVWCTYTKM